MNKKRKITIVSDPTQPKDPAAVRVLLLSDTHVIADKIPISSYPEVDIVVHAGDFSMKGRAKEVKAFLSWYQTIKAKHKVFICGNHETALDRNHKEFEKSTRELLFAKQYSDLIYLENLTGEVMGIKIFGSPYSPEFYGWGFPTPDDAYKLYKEKITDDTDIVLIHGPPYGILDKCVDGTLAGCKILEKRLKECSPGMCVFGHIHEAYGIVEKNGTLFVNASNSDFHYDFTQKPIFVDIIKNK